LSSYRRAISILGIQYVKTQAARGFERVDMSQIQLEPSDVETKAKFPVLAK
jgi:hypothetical protein